MQQCMAVSFSEVKSKFLKLTAMVRTPTDREKVLNCQPGDILEYAEKGNDSQI